MFWSYCFTPPQFGGFGIVMVFVGFLIGSILVCCFHRFCSGWSCSICIPGNWSKYNNSTLIITESVHRISLLKYSWIIFQDSTIQNINGIIPMINVIWGNTYFRYIFQTVIKSEPITVNLLVWQLRRLIVPFIPYRYYLRITKQ